MWYFAESQRKLDLILFLFELNWHLAFGVFLEYICEIFLQKFTYVMNLQYHGGLLHIHDNLIKQYILNCFGIVLVDIAQCKAGLTHTSSQFL